MVTKKARNSSVATATAAAAAARAAGAAAKAAAGMRHLAEEARSMAVSANAFAVAHDKLCTERWEIQHGLTQEMRSDIKALLATRSEMRGGMKLVHVMWVLFGALCSAAAWAVARGWPHP